MHNWTYKPLTGLNNPLVFGGEHRPGGANVDNEKTQVRAKKETEQHSYVLDHHMHIHD